ncbi:MAG TPA: hypothetical protein VFK15_07995 [Burkholderiales bacterium]|nr:hypothetical protein [Burkholderiales bacterium]
MKQFSLAGAALAALVRPGALAFRAMGAASRSGAPRRDQPGELPRGFGAGLRRDRLRIGLGAHWICIAGYRGSARGAPAFERVIPRDNAAADWPAALELMPQLLPQRKRRRLSVTVVLSDRFVRYAVLPWSEVLKTETEWLALARHRFVSVHGGLAEQWQLRVAKAPYGCPRLACAMDVALLAELQKAIGARARLVSVQPHLMACYNRLAPGLRRGSCWLVIDEAGRLTVALLEKGVWRAIRHRRKPDCGPGGLAQLLDRESALLGLAQPRHEIMLCSHEPLDETVLGGYRLRDVTFGAHHMAADRRLAMALE